MMRERWYGLALAIPLLLAAASSCDVGQGEARGHARFGNCSPCHGADGSGNPALGAPAIAGLPSWYVETQLRKFRDGARGAHPDDYAGLRMRPMARTLRQDEDVKAIALYVEHLQVKGATARLSGGDATRGKALFATCAACHGDRAQGQRALNTPNLHSTGDWYLFEQLKKFKSGVRGSGPGDSGGAVMRGAVAALADEAAMKDVLAYIQTLE
jgi:cytochrome c oxidase subunit 2